VATGPQLARAVVETLRRRAGFPSETAGIVSEHGPATKAAYTPRYALPMNFKQRKRQRHAREVSMYGKPAKRIYRTAHRMRDRKLWRRDEKAC
jgi:hypothetical protein